MSFFMPQTPASRDDGMPRGELVATYSTYATAREQVDKLAAGDFPVTAVSIVGKDLRVVERVRGRMSYSKVALGAALRGLIFGALIGLFMVLINPAGGWNSVLFSALLGVGVWMIFGVIGFSLRKGQSGGAAFASTQQLVPVAYDLVVAFEHAAQAKQILGLTGAGTAIPTPAGSAAPSAPAPAPATGGGSTVAAPHGSATVRDANANADAAAPVTAATSGGGPGAAASEGAGQGETPSSSTDGGETPSSGPQTGTGQGADVPVGLDKSYGLRLSDEEVRRLIEARGGTVPPAGGAAHGPADQGDPQQGAAESEGHRGR
ncbi:MAG: hypothetical protein Q4G34_09890 [Micrococcus sp.]|nr:hypothetical protein [Micrococcus sp.]